MLDVGLIGGVNTLWQEDLLLDYTVKVEAREFHVHKVVLASVSDYFRAMLTGPMMESGSDHVELKDISAERVSDIINFIYTGNYDIIERNPKEILEYAIYFQMAKVIQICTSKLKSILCIENCLDLLSTFRMYSLNEAEHVEEFIKLNLTKVMTHFKMDTLTPEGIQVILKAWRTSDWDMFNYLKCWFSVDSGHRRRYMNGFMSHVRFSILTSTEISAIKEMDIYKDSDGGWKDLVDKAFAYHQLPIHLKVLDDSEQSMVRSDKSLIVMDTSSHATGPTSYSLVKGKWKPTQWLRSPQFIGPIFCAIEVNNFLITCSKFSEDQTWQVFDPRTLTWSNIASMPKPWDEFALVHYNKQLYVLGGCEASATDQKSPSDTITEYSFETNSWSSTKKLPLAVRNHAACVFNDAIYICGGEAASGTTNRLDCLNRSSHTWESKAPMLKAMAGHNMFVMRFNSDEVILIVSEALWVGYYNVVTGQWSTCDFRIWPVGEDRLDFRDVIDLQWVPKRSMMVLVNGNCLMLFNVQGKEWQPTDSDYEDDDIVEPNYNLDYDHLPAHGLCMRWKIALKSHEIRQHTFNDFPLTGPMGGPAEDAIAFLLAVPPCRK